MVFVGSLEIWLARDFPGCSNEKELGDRMNDNDCREPDTERTDRVEETERLSYAL